MKYLYVLILSAAIFGCATTTTRPQNASDYETQLTAPATAGSLELISKTVFENPWGGVNLKYGDRRFPQDLIDVFVYPIPEYDLEEKQDNLEAGIESLIAEVDHFVENGQYISRSEVNIEDFEFDKDDKLFRGQKVSFQIEMSNGRLLDSHGYLFISEDKYIKFRTSYDLNEEIPWNGDNVVKSILPHIAVPPESQFAKQARLAEQQRFEKQILNLLLQAIGDKNSEDDSDTESTENID